MKKILFLAIALVLIFGLVNTSWADLKSGKISLGVHVSSGGFGLVTAGFGVADIARIDVGIGSLSFTQGSNSPVSIAGIFYYNFNPRAQNVMHAFGDVMITFNYSAGGQVVQQNTVTLFTVGGGIGWECFINRDFSVDADISLASVTFGGGGSTFTVLQPLLSAHYYF